MLLSKTAKVKWNGANKKYFVDRGYVFTKLHEYFDVKIEDLAANTKSYVECKCDCCNEKYTTRYDQYLKRKYKKTYCKKCTTMVSRTLKPVLNDNKLSFEQWCIDNNRQDVLDSWNYDLNMFKPNEILYNTQKEYWFNCPNNKNHHPESFRLSNITEGYKEINRGASSCRQCYAESEMCKEHISSLEYKVRKYLEYLMYSVKYEYECSIVPINYKTNRLLPFDNEVVDLKLIIEVHGAQHYKLTGFHYELSSKYDTTPEEELEYQQWKDQYKKEYALSHGYEYLEIPYTAEANDEYKQLIDDKIAEINNKLKGEQTYEIN